MPIYSVVRNASSNTTVVLPGGGFVFMGIRAVYSFGIAVDPTASATSGYFSYGPTGTSSGAGEEKFNTRSASTFSTLTTGVVTPTANLCIDLNNTVSFQAWRSDYRRLPLLCSGYDATSRRSFICNTVAPTSRCSTLVYSDGILNFTRRSKRGRTAYFFHSANDNCLHKATGGGAFEWTSRPHYLNDGITWADERVWDLGQVPGDAWSMQLFGASGSTTIEADGSSTGTSAVTANAASIFAGITSAPGTSTTSYVGASLFTGAASTAGTSTGSFDSLAIFSAMAASDGTSTASAVSVSFNTATAASNGTSTVTGTASTIASAQASADCVSSVTADGEAIERGVVAEATGTSTATAVSSVIAGVVTSSQGTSTASAVGEDSAAPVVPPPIFVVGGAGAPVMPRKHAALLQADGYAFGLSKTNFAGAMLVASTFGLNTGPVPVFAYSEGIVNLLPEELTALMEEMD